MNLVDEEKASAAIVKRITDLTANLELLRRQAFEANKAVTSAEVELKNQCIALSRLVGKYMDQYTLGQVNPKLFVNQERAKNDG